MEGFPPTSSDMSGKYQLYIYVIVNVNGLYGTRAKESYKL